MIETLYTTEELSKALKVDVQTIRNWLRDGLLDGVKIGKKEYRVSENEVTRFLNGNEKQII